MRLKSRLRLYGRFDRVILRVLFEKFSKYFYNCAHILVVSRIFKGGIPSDMGSGYSRIQPRLALIGSLNLLSVREAVSEFVKEHVKRIPFTFLYYFAHFTVSFFKLFVKR